MKKAFFLVFISCAVSSLTHSQTSAKETNLAASVQLYPAGTIPTINLEQFVSKNGSLVYRLGGNFTDRRDFSDENDSEEGAGFGGSFGYRKHFSVGNDKIIAGFNTDLWNLWIDWRDNVGSPAEADGRTYILVLQPWLEAGYFFKLNNTRSSLGLTAGFGREINVITNGEDVAQGFIASLSIQYQFSLKK